jgi:hypothetical protein
LEILSWLLDNLLEVFSVAMAAAALLITHNVSKANAKNSEMALAAQDKPRIDVKSMVHSPKGLIVYAGNDVLWTGKKSITAFKDMIDEYRRSVNLVEIGNHGEYMLVNLLHKNYDINKAMLILNVLDIELVNYSNPSDYVKLECAYSLLSGATEVYHSNQYHVCLTPIDHGGFQVFPIKIAYACEYNQPASINYQRFMNYHSLSDDEKKPFDIKQHPDRAKEVLAFTDSAYLFKTRGDSGMEYSHTFHMTLKGTFSAKRYNGAEKYKELLKIHGLVSPEKSGSRKR